MPRGTSSSKKIETRPQTPMISQKDPAATGGHPVLRPIMSSAVMRLPAAWMLSTG